MISKALKYKGQYKLRSVKAIALLQKRKMHLRKNMHTKMKQRMVVNFTITRTLKMSKPEMDAKVKQSTNGKSQY